MRANDRRIFALVQATKQDIRQLDRAALETLCLKWDEPGFRGKQIYEWLWKKSARDFDAMSNLPQALRDRLDEAYEIRNLELDLHQKSQDGTIKCRFRLFDGHLIEGVLIPTPERVTACVSSQVGCSLSCSFCATGFMKLQRNLEPGEIYDQVVMLNNLSVEHYEQPLSNIVFMGMGEPLLNYKNVLAGIDRIAAEDGLGISARRITVSTAGIAKMMRRLGEDQVRFNLALSLHAPDDEKRSRIMPINDSNRLDVLINAMNDFYLATRNRMTFEYILFDGFNDTQEDARKLVALCRRVPAKVNLIEYNPVEKVAFTKSGEGRRERFIAYLEAHDVTTVLRRSRGKDIDAACGQLANK